MATKESRFREDDLDLEDDDRAVEDSEYEPEEVEEDEVEPVRAKAKSNKTRVVEDDEDMVEEKTTKRTAPTSKLVRGGNKTMATKKNTEAVAKPKAKVTEMKHRGTAKGSKPASAERAKARHPFPDEQSMVAGAFELTQRPDGVTIKALKTFIEKHKTGKTAF